MVHYATLDIEVQKPTVSTISFKESSVIVSSDVDSESEEYKSASNKLKYIDNGKELHSVKSISEPMRVKSDDERQHFVILQQSLAFFRSFGYMLGIDFSFTWKPNPKYYLMLFLLVFIWTQIFYTEYVHIKNKEYYKLLEVLACFGILLSVMKHQALSIAQNTSVKVTQVLCTLPKIVVSEEVSLMVLKLWAFLAGYKGSTAIFNSTRKICKLNLIGFRATKIRDRLKENFKFYKLTAFVVILSILIFVAYPAKALIIDGEFVPLLPILFMFVDQSTLSGFLSANAMMAFMGLMANCATVYCILVIVATVFNYSVLVDMIEEDIKSLDNMWSGNSDTTIQYRYLYLRNICIKQQDMDEYIMQIKKYLDVYIFIYFCANYFGQIVCLFQIVVSDWKSGYAIAYCMFLEMMFYCLMGTKLSSENERILSVLQESKWYSYDMHSQKIFAIMYHASLNAKELWIGPIAPLTVYTGTDIIKSIYSYYNIMLEVV